MIDRSTSSQVAGLAGVAGVARVWLPVKFIAADGVQMLKSKFFTSHPPTHVNSTTNLPAIELAPLDAWPCCVTPFWRNTRDRLRAAAIPRTGTDETARTEIACRTAASGRRTSAYNAARDPAR